nr:MAG: hypothetical protein DIU61_07595 [Bacteroidota bacterium]
MKNYFNNIFKSFWLISGRSGKRLDPAFRRRFETPHSDYSSLIETFSFEATLGGSLFTKDAIHECPIVALIGFPELI